MTDNVSMEKIIVESTKASYKLESLNIPELSKEQSKYLDKILSKYFPK